MSELPHENAEELYQNAPCGYFSTLPGGSFIRVNQTFLKWTGYRQDELLGRRWQELLTIPGQIFYETHFFPLLCMQGFVREISCDLMRPQQHPLPVLVNAVQVLDTSGQPALLRFTLFDATDRRRYERELLLARRQSEHYAEIVRTSSDAVLGLTPAGVVQSWNPAAEWLFGYSEAEAVGRSVYQLIHLEGLENQIALIAEPNDPHSVQLETLGTTKDQRRLNIALSLTPFIEPPGELTGLSLILRDITQTKLREQQRLLQAALEERQKLARELHDSVSQELYGIILGLKSAMGTAGIPAKAQDALFYASRMSETAMAEMKNLIFELRPESLAQEGLVEALRKHIRPLELRYNLRFELSLEEPALELILKETLYRIAQEAINNIIKHARATTVQVSLKQTQGILLTIGDNGQGFDGKQSFPGHLGLVSMRERAMLVGGEFRVNSQPGQGTKVEVYLPALGGEGRLEGHGNFSSP